MDTSWIVITYLLIRVFVDLLRIGFSKGFSKFSFSQFIAAYAIFSIMVFLVFLESYAIVDLLRWEFSTTFSLIFSTTTFIFGYEFSEYLFNRFYGEKRLSEKQRLNFKIFRHYFFNSLFGIIFSIIATFTLLFL
ncbi:hypothetical protein A2863_01595 [Candidatus Woesebacteria bacterium RIFCSPHIGHO2_01_FULL_38_9b]|uniref:Uncharacterized protein n=1 Tax=Candidatus Woesebacteria bacterium RIFCSPHIGHO2_01_FULL_38_9b TaxID=1802493 RepID=A0A1F7Y2A7_9BACT|nr:MAG: hypothetical protein A2863_01595 [Candidatus Woesebacteria bacterium RIFCSPHIGHO2_01_FULL_38_9b]